MSRLPPKKKQKTAGTITPNVDHFKKAARASLDSQIALQTAWDQGAGDDASEYRELLKQGKGMNQKFENLAAFHDASQAQQLFPVSDEQRHIARRLHTLVEELADKRISDGLEQAKPTGNKLLDSKEQAGMEELTATLRHAFGRIQLKEQNQCWLPPGRIILDPCHPDYAVPKMDMIPESELPELPKIDIDPSMFTNLTKTVYVDGKESEMTLRQLEIHEEEIKKAKLKAAAEAKAKAKAEAKAKKTRVKIKAEPTRPSLEEWKAKHEAEVDRKLAEEAEEEETE